MRIAIVLVAGAAVTLAACDTLMAPPPQTPVVPPAAGPAGTATLTVANKAPFGSYVVDGSGRAVYILEGTRGMSGINMCSGQCLAHWPPMMIVGMPSASRVLNQRQLRAVSGYGGTQVSFSGWPLYYYHRDQAPGDTTGQAVRDQWGTWYLVRPNGDPIRPGY